MNRHVSQASDEAAGVLVLHIVEGRVSTRHPLQGGAILEVREGTQGVCAAVHD